MISHRSDDSSLCHQLRTLSGQSQDGLTGQGMPNSQVRAIRHEEPERDPQQEDQPDATIDEDIEDYNLDIDYKGSELEAEQSAQEEWVVDPDAEHVKIGIP